MRKFEVNNIGSQAVQCEACGKYVGIINTLKCKINTIERELKSIKELFLESEADNDAERADKLKAQIIQVIKETYTKRVNSRSTRKINKELKELNFVPWSHIQSSLSRSPYIKFSSDLKQCVDSLLIDNILIEMGEEQRDVMQYKGQAFKISARLCTYPHTPFFRDSGSVAPPKTIEQFSNPITSLNKSLKEVLTSPDLPISNTSHIEPVKPIEQSKPTKKKKVELTSDSEPKPKSKLSHESKPDSKPKLTPKSKSTPKPFNEGGLVDGKVKLKMCSKEALGIIKENYSEKMPEPVSFDDCSVEETFPFHTMNVGTSFELLNNSKSAKEAFAYMQEVSKKLKNRKFTIIENEDIVEFFRIL